MTLEKIKSLAFKENLSIKDYLNTYGKKIDIYYSGWEGDNVGWIFENTVFMTNHGALYIEEDFQKYISDLEKYIKDLKKLL